MGWEDLSQVALKREKGNWVFFLWVVVGYLDISERTKGNYLFIGNKN
ncbi:hypothetical protein COLO4_32108 [Corchorus olitorius]|uniref:Uncharacterized protein n=1 Tax=Corchorus olitorius TaxID=93759 RepID=A0A1R3H1B4_9ROSI|nr:hypothetical protein COLO4_32108 [Corchorus olitorius]